MLVEYVNPFLINSDRSLWIVAGTGGHWWFSQGGGGGGALSER